MSDLQRLRVHAISQSLFAPVTLKAAVERMGFIQADPIRSPARAQDLILRHRVKGYHAGDLERRYASLAIEEDFLYAYGFLHRRVWEWIHPRDPAGLSALEKSVFETVCRFGVMHPRELESHFGRKRVINAWGGYSKATTHALEHLHYRGLLRIARREDGIRVYEAAPPSGESLPPRERLRKLIMVIANLLAPAPFKSLQATVGRRYRYLGDPHATLREMIANGELQKSTVDGVDYLWQPCRTVQKEAPLTVRFLAPFDPLVWHRKRFEHFWGWPYRFEAYTPVAKRIRGYYAMPLLWGDSIIGWANAGVAAGRLNVDVGFVQKRPREPLFRAELEAEIERMKAFLSLNTSSSSISPWQK